jgi:hypothetical protein
MGFPLFSMSWPSSPGHLVWGVMPFQVGRRHKSGDDRD